MSRTTYRRRSVLLTAAMAAGAAATLVVGAAPAQAATGRLTLAQLPGGPVYQLVNPSAGCYPVRAGFDFVDNRLDSYVTTYPGSFCAGFGTVVSPGSAVTLPATAYSVRVAT